MDIMTKISSNAVTRERWIYRSIDSLLFVLSMTFDPQYLIVFKREIRSSSVVRYAETDFAIDSNFGLAMRSHFLVVFIFSWLYPSG